MQEADNRRPRRRKPGNGKLSRVRGNNNHKEERVAAIIMEDERYPNYWLDYDTDLDSRWPHRV